MFDYLSNVKEVRRDEIARFEEEQKQLLKEQEQDALEEE